MTRQLSDAEWEELAVLIEEAPPGRLRVVMKRLQVPTAQMPARASRLTTSVDRVFHLAAVTTDSTFDRALLRELRRLNVH